MLDIKTAEDFLKADDKIRLNPFCVRHADNFVLKDKVILVINCDSDLFLHPLLRSLYKNVNQNEFTLIIWDNSYSAKFNEDIYFNYGFNNILFLDNTRCYIDDLPKRNLVDVGELEIKNNREGSVIHAKTIDFVIKYLIQENVKDLILVDSDVLFKQNPLNVIDRNYTCKGFYNEYIYRIEPFLEYFNLDKIKQYGLNFFDSSRILGISSDSYLKYDTGGSFTEDLFKIGKSEFCNIDLDEYIVHFGGGSYIYVAEKDPKLFNISEKEKRQYSYNLIYEWLNKNQKYYL